MRTDPLHEVCLQPAPRSRGSGGSACGGGALRPWGLPWPRGWGGACGPTAGRRAPSDGGPRGGTCSRVRGGSVPVSRPWPSLVGHSWQRGCWAPPRAAASAQNPTSQGLEAPPGPRRLDSCLLLCTGGEGRVASPEGQASPRPHLQTRGRGSVLSRGTQLGAAAGRPLGKGWGEPGLVSRLRARVSWPHTPGGVTWPVGPLRPAWAWPTPGLA